MVSERHSLSDSIACKLTAFLKQYHSIKSVWVAYSGGLDSEVLLNVVAAYQPFDQQVMLRAIHVHHGLNPHANAWVLHCQQHCEKLQVPLKVVHINVQPHKGQSLEEIARHQRYQAFNEIMTNTSVLLTAHHQDDQAETVLLRLFSGAGPKGLASMRTCRPLGKGLLLRPLLPFSRHELEEFASANSLVWIEDDSNLNQQFSRNFVRHQVLPLLKQRWPSVITTLTRSATLCHENEILLQELMQDDFDRVKTNEQHKLRVSALNQLSKAKQQYLLRHWIEMNAYTMPSQAQLNQLISSILLCQNDRMPVLTWNNACVRRYQDELYIEPVMDDVPTVTLQWDLQQPLPLPAYLGTLMAESCKNQGIKLPHDVTVTVTFRQGGERCHPQGRIGSHPLKKLFQEWNVPPWRRDKIPLIYYQQHLVAVVGYCVCEPWAAQAGEMGLQFRLLK